MTNRGRLAGGTGLCSKCGGSRDTTGTYCRACRSAYSNQRQKDQRARLKALEQALKMNQGHSEEPLNLAADQSA